MKFYLIVAKGKKQGLPIPVEVDLFMIGTSKMCQLRSKIPGVGEQHCVLVRRQRKVFVRDLGSGEPTLLNGSVLPPSEEWQVHAGDHLEVGPLLFVLEFRERPLSQRDLEEWALRCLDKDGDHEFEDPLEGLRAAERRPLGVNPAEAAASIIDRLQAKRGLVLGRLRIGMDSGVTVVRFNDRHIVEEATIALLKKELCENLASPNLRVLLDFKMVSRMSTAAVIMIEELYTWLRPWGTTLALCRMRKEIQSILKPLDFAHTVPIFNDKKLALTSRW
jgi:anti-anti-sigma regulatory factor